MVSQLPRQRVGEPAGDEERDRQLLEGGDEGDKERRQEPAADAIALVRGALQAIPDFSTSRRSPTTIKGWRNPGHTSLQSADLATGRRLPVDRFSSKKQRAH